MRRNMKMWKESVLASKKRLTVPIMTQPGITRIGRTVLDAVTQSSVHGEAVRALAQAYPTGASAMIMDLSVEAEAFGAKIRFSEVEVPTVTERCVYDADSIDELAVPSLNAGRAGVYVEASKIASSVITDRPVFAGCIGPFSLAGRLFDVTEIMTAILIDPEPIHRLLKKATRFLVSYVLAFKEAGANGVVIAEPVAGVLSEEHCTEFSSHYVREIVAAAQDDNFLVILHNCGDTDTLVSSMHGTGAAGLHFGNRCDIVAALRQLPPDLLVFGNLDPSGVIKSGDPLFVAAETNRLLEATRPFRNFILSSGCDVPPGVPAENIDAIFKALEQFNEKSE